MTVTLTRMLGSTPTSSLRRRTRRSWRRPRPSIAETQASDFRRRFPGWDRYGLSAYYARSDSEVDDLAADQLERFPVLAVFGIAELEAHGFEVVATFRTPHVTLAFDGDLTTRLAALATLARHSMPDPYYESEPSDPPFRRSR